MSPVLFEDEGLVGGQPKVQEAVEAGPRGAIFPIRTTERMTLTKEKVNASAEVCQRKRLKR